MSANRVVLTGSNGFKVESLIDDKSVDAILRIIQKQKIKSPQHEVVRGFKVFSTTDIILVAADAKAREGNVGGWTENKYFSDLYKAARGTRHSAVKREVELAASHGLIEINEDGTAYRLTDKGDERLLDLLTDEPKR